MEIKVYGTPVHIEEQMTDICGLKFKPQMTQYDNNEDWSVFTRGHPVEVSTDDFNLVEVAANNYSTHGIMEIGVCRNGMGSFTHALLRNKPNHIPYLGVDLEDKTFLNNKEKNVFTIQSNSHDQDKVRSYAKEIGLEKISILLIDGWHSVNTCINDWLYSDMLSDNGIVIFHDTNGHPGPSVFLNAIDNKVYKVVKYFEDKDDCGIGVAYKIPV